MLGERPSSEKSKAPRTAEKIAPARMRTESEFRAFLEYLDPVLPDYQSQLKSSGIQCADDMRALVRFSRENLREFLKNECDIVSAFEVYKVLDALDGARAKLNVED